MKTEQELPQVEAPHLAQAALANQVRDVAMTTPRLLSLSHVHGVGKVKRMQNHAMQLRESGYVCANWIQYLDTPAQKVADLLGSEAKEVQDAAWRQAPPDGTLPARRLSLMFLSRGKTSLGGPELLNAASHLACEVPFGCSECSARACRFAFLAGEDAEQFLKLRRDALPEASRRAELIAPVDGVGELSVAVTWAVRMQTQTVLHTRVARLPTPSARGNVADLCDAIVAAVSEICAHNSIPATNGITANRNAPSPDSFVHHQAKVYASFQALLLPETTVTLSEHMRQGVMDFGLHYVRITSRFYPVNHYSAQMGLLLHEKGKFEQTQAFLNSLREEESSEIYGLRPPSGAYEQQLGLHVLSATAESTPLGTQVSCYGIGAHPGARLDVRDGCCVWNVKRSVAPLEAWLSRERYVLPCSRDSSHPRSGVLCLPLFELMEDAVISTPKIFGANVPVAKIKQSFSIPPRAATDEDRFLTTAFGLGLHVDAVRVGDVHDRLAGVSGRADGLTRLLLIAISKVGAAASVTEALGWIADYVPALENRLKALEDDVHGYRDRESKRSDPTPEPAKTRVDWECFIRAATALGLKQAPSGVAMTHPPKEDEVEKLLTVVSRVLGKKKKDIPGPTATEARSAHANCDQESLVARVVAVVGAVAGSFDQRVLLFCGDRLLHLDAEVGLHALFTPSPPSLLLLAGSTLQYFQP